MYRQEAIIEGNGSVFKVGDVVEVHFKKVYEVETNVCQGRILMPVTLSELRLDTSTKYHSNIVEIEVYDIVGIYNV